MNFIMKRTSDYSEHPNPNDPEIKVKIHINNHGYEYAEYIRNIRTLKELIDYIYTLGEEVVLSVDKVDGKLMAAMEIYDDYRE